VVDEFLFRPEVALQAFFGAMNDVARVMHARGDGFFVRPVARGVRTEPGRGWAMAVFAGDAFGYLEWPAALLGRGVKRVAREALRSFFRFRAQLQNAGHPFADIASQRLVGVAVLVLDDPGRIFVLQDPAASDRLDAAVAACRGARARSDVFHRLGAGVGVRGDRRCGGCGSRILRFGAGGFPRCAIVRGCVSQGGRKRRDAGGAQHRCQPTGFVGDFHSKCRTSLSVHYRLSGGEVNDAALSFSQRGAKRQRASIYRATMRQ